MSDAVHPVNPNPPAKTKSGHAQSGGAWKATAGTWVVTDPVQSPTGPTPSAKPTPTESTIKVTPKVLPKLDQTGGGAVHLSASANVDRAVCDDYASSLTFSPPNGKVNDTRFASGSFSNDLVRYFNSFWDPQLKRSYSVRTTGEHLPVFRFADGSAFVACTFERHHSLAGSSASGTVKFDKGTDTDVLLGGGGRQWRSVQEISNFAALFEVPAGDASPATVLTSLQLRVDVVAIAVLPDRSVSAEGLVKWPDHPCIHRASGDRICTACRARG